MAKRKQSVTDQTATPFHEEHSISGALDLFINSLQIYKDLFPKLVGVHSIPFIYSIVFALVFALNGKYIFDPTSTDVFHLNPFAIAFWTTHFLISSFVTLPATYILLDNNITLKEALVKGLRNSPRYIFTVVLTLSITFLGIVALVVPGIILLVFFCTTSYVYANEGLFGLKALSRSKEYVKSHFWAVFFNLLILFIINALISWGLDSAVRPLLPSNFKDLGIELQTTLLYPFTDAYLFLLYQDLKKAHG